jgi:hypothetical protein
VVPPDELVEVSLKVLPAQVVVDIDQRALCLEDDRLGGVDVSTRLRVGILLFLWTTV